MDQPQTTEQMLQEQLAKLPPDVQKAVLSVEWEEKVRIIGERHKLHVDQAGALGDATLMAMLGMLPLEQYPARLAADLRLPAADAEVIAKEVNDEVFTNIRESLKQITQHPAPAMSAQKSSDLLSGAKPAAPAGQTFAPTSPVSATAPAKPDLTKADAMLAATMVQTPAAPAAPLEAKPQNYAADPYREPPIP